MKKSQSSSTHRRINKKNKKPTSKPKKIYSQLNTQRGNKQERSKTKENQHLTPSKGIQLRVANIRKGFEDLQKKLNFSTEKKSNIFKSNFSPTDEKKKFYPIQQKLSKSRKKKIIRTQSKKNSQYIRHHQCIYQKSFHHLLKIISQQKEKIDRLQKNKTSKRKK